MFWFPRTISLLLFCAVGLLGQAARPAPSIPDDVVFEPAQRGSPQVDIVRPRAASDSLRPAVLCIHGGGFRAGSRTSYLPLGIELARRGYVAALVDYQLAPRAQFPAAVHDVKAAVRWVRANAVRLGVDPERIGVTGQSAGGTLALLLGVTAGNRELEGYGPHLEQSSSVAAVVDFYGATDFTKSYGKSVDAADVLPQFLGGDLENARMAHLKASPLYWITPAAAPVLAIHGTKDRYVAFEQSQWLMERMKASGATAELLTLDGADHGFKGADAEKAERAMFAFFDRHLSAPKEERKILVANHGSGGEVVAMSWPNGKILWRVPNQNGHDVQGLPNGHVLYTLNPVRRVIEMDAAHQPVWEYGVAEGLEHPITAQRLANGNTLIGDAKLGKVIEVTSAKKIVWEYASPDLADMRLREARRTDAGTTLIAVEAAGKIIEVDAAGKIIWTFESVGGAKRRPYLAHRLSNGNTLVSQADPGEVVEVDRAGKVVRSWIGGGNDVKLAWVSGTALLPGGGLLISDYTGRRLIEIDAKGKIVHQLDVGNWGISSVSLVPCCWN